MRKLIVFLLLFPLLSISQDKGYVHFSGAIEFPVNGGNNAFGLNVGGNFKAGRGFYAGVAVGVMKFQNQSSIYLPISATFTVIPYKDRSSLMFMAQPGYGIYQTSGIIGEPDKRGGFTFYSGLGFRAKGGGFLLFGYSLYTFTYFYGVGKAGLLGLRAGAAF